MKYDIIEKILIYTIYTTIGIVRCTLGLGTDDLAVNPTSHTKVYFNEFVANALRDNMGIVIFDL